jgi:hypothetical protein
MDFRGSFPRLRYVNPGIKDFVVGKIMISDWCIWERDCIDKPAAECYVKADEKLSFSTDVSSPFLG